MIITCDRYLNVTRPLTYRAKRTKKRAVLVILLAWTVSILIWTPSIIGWQYTDGRRAVPAGKCYVQFLLSNKTLTLVTAALAFYVPVLLMLILYWKMYSVTRRRQRELAHLREKCEKLQTRTCQDCELSSTNSPSASASVSVSFCAADRRPPSPPRSSRLSLPLDRLKLLVHGNRTDWPRTSSPTRQPDCHSALLHAPNAAAASSSVAGQSPIANFNLRRLDSALRGKRKRRVLFRSDVKAARTISAVLLAFIVTW